MSTPEQVLKLGGRAHVLTDNAACRVLNVTISSLLGMSFHEHNREFVERAITLLNENIDIVESNRESDRAFAQRLSDQDLAVIKSGNK